MRYVEVLGRFGRPEPEILRRSRHRDCKIFRAAQGGEGTARKTREDGPRRANVGRLALPGGSRCDLYLTKI